MPARSGSRHAGASIIVPVTAPFRLDYTVAALQRVATNPVEVWTGDGRYLRAFSTREGPVVWEVYEGGSARSLHLHLHGRSGPSAPWESLLHRVLGTDLDLRSFYALASGVPSFAPLAEQFRGLKPPRFATLWESLVNAIAFQQLSLASGMAAVGRLTQRCTRPISFEAVSLHPFPGPEAVTGLSDADLRACGFSASKARTLKGAAAAVLCGALREDELERLGNDEVVARLTELPGVGPWTASIVLLRGLRRLDCFPIGDSGADRRLRALFRGMEPARLLAHLGSWRGMLYFHLLLASRFGVPPVRKRRDPGGR